MTPPLPQERPVRLASGPGEVHAVRNELGTPALPGREGRRAGLLAGLLAFVHFTDIHVSDAQSPGRLEFLDRYNDGPGEPLIFGSAYRPQEFLTPQVSDSLVSAVERVGIGPVSHRALDFAVCTGDNTDNAQLNALDRTLRRVVEDRWAPRVRGGRAALQVVGRDAGGEGTAYYAFDPSPQVRGIVLDSVNPNGESSGSLDRAQFTWLREQLEPA